MTSALLASGAWAILWVQSVRSHAAYATPAAATWIAAVVTAEVQIVAAVTAIVTVGTAIANLGAVMSADATAVVTVAVRSSRDAVAVRSTRDAIAPY